MGPGNPLFNDPDKHPGRITQFSESNQPETQGRPLGVKNRSTIARKILEMNTIVPEQMFEAIKAVFPNIEQTMTAEEVATFAMLAQCVSKGDVNSYKAIMDSAYGAPKQETENTNTTTVTQVFKIGDKEFPM
jgi:hypothetical protein